MMILKSLKIFLNDVIKNICWPERLQLFVKRDSNTGFTLMIQKSLKSFLNDGTKKVP